jgi:sugar lactone lactonase YvrE
MKQLALLLSLVFCACAVSAAGDWQSFVHSNHVADVWVDDDYVYWGSTGGVVIMDRLTGAESKVVKAVNGLRSNNVTAIEKDSAGRLWIGTADEGVGVLGPDGTWAFHSTGNLHLLSDEVTDIATLEALTVVATTGGITLFEDGQFSTFYDGSDWENSDCSKVPSAAIGESEVLVGTYCGVFSLDLTERSWSAVIPEPGEYRVDYNGSDTYWVTDTVDSLIYTYNGSNIEIISKAQIRPDAIYDVTARDSMVWVSTSNGPATYDFANQYWVRYKDNLVYRLQDSRPIFVAADTTVWLCTEDGMGILEEEGWEFIISAGPGGNYIRDIAVGGNGDVWCTTGERGGGPVDAYIGLLHYDGFAWEHMRDPEITSDRTYCVETNPVDGAVWVGFWHPGRWALVRFDAASGEMSSHTDLLKAQVVADIHFDDDGSMVLAEYTYGLGIVCPGEDAVHYIKTEDSDCINTYCVTAVGPGPEGGYVFGDYCELEVYRLNPGPSCTDKTDDDCELWTSVDGLIKGFAYAVARDPFGVVWLGTSGGLSAYDGTWHAVSSTMGVVWAIEIDSFGNKWVGCDQGLYMLRGFGTEWGDFEDDYELYDGSNSPLDGAPVKGLAFDADGALWIGTGGGGVRRYSPPKVEVQQKSWVEVFPNPYSEGNPDYHSKIQFSGYLPGSKIRIYTIAGELVAEIDANSAWTQERMEEQEIASGVYIYRARAEDGREFTGRFVIIR